MARTRTLNLVRALIGGAQPHLVGGPLSHVLYIQWWGGGTRYEVDQSATRPIDRPTD
jgi:hypothetical protein